MRLLVLFLVCSIGLSYAADSYAQKAMISIDVHNQRVEDILKEIEAQQEGQYQYLNLNEQQSVWLTSSMSKEQCRSMVEQLAGLLHKRYDVTCFAAISEPMEDPVNSMGAI